MSQKYKYNEKEILDAVSEYVLSTYQGHYVASDEIQTLDVWKALDSVESTCRDTALKYLFRFGKKEGKNKKDLLKAIHYIVLLMHFSGVMDEAHNGNEVKVDPNKRTRK
jgi:Protein of unknwon function (DUF3310)